MNDVQTRWCIGTVPAKHRNTYRKAMTGRKALVAIRQKCLDCMNWQESEIRRCEIEHCPLWPYRMGRMARQPARSEAVALANP